MIRVLGTMLILLRLSKRNLIFGAEVNISARAEILHIMATKKSTFLSNRVEIRHIINPLVYMYILFILDTSSKTVAPKAIN